MKIIFIYCIISHNPCDSAPVKEKEPKRRYIKLIMIRRLKCVYYSSIEKSKLMVSRKQRDLTEIYNT